MRCIDVSEFQGNIDWNKVKADGIEGVIIRAGYGRGNVDEKFEQNINGAIAAGLHIGAYWFSYAFDDDMATNEARCIVNFIEPYKDSIDMPVFFDWEYDSMNYAKKKGYTPDKDSITSMTRAFCKEVESLGYSAGYYLNWDYSRNYYDESQLEDYKRWFAWWEDELEGDCYLWQTSDMGSVNGINGNVDTDTLLGELCRPSSEPTEKPSEPSEGQETPHSEPQSYYKVGDVYTVDVNTALNVRTGAGTDYPTVGYYGLTPDGRAHANAWGALYDGTRVTCLAIEQKGDDVWMQIPSGWICAKQGDYRYVV